MRGNDDAKQIARCAVLACLLEATVRKPGNVHPQASFRDLTYADFVRSAHLIGPSFEHAGEWSVGRIVRDAVERTRREVSTNTNLGILLLLAPLASVPPGVTIADGIGGVLAGLTREDARLVYEAIRLANPGGLGQVENEDVAAEPSVTLLEAMQLAADRDRIAQQFANNFATVRGSRPAGSGGKAFRTVGRGGDRASLMVDGPISGHAHRPQVRRRIGPRVRALRAGRP